MDFKKSVVGLGFLCSSVANAGTVLAPTDGDVNFYVNDPFPYTLAIFDNDSFGGSDGLAGLDVVLSGPVLGLLGGTINFSNESPAGSGQYTATNGSELLNLSGGNLFMVGVWDGSQWHMDTAPAQQLPANGAQLTFNVGGDVVAVDVAVIPVPGAVWLFATGLVGLVAVARRRG
jgi:hypothetical protein